VQDGDIVFERRVALEGKQVGEDLVHRAGEHLRQRGLMRELIDEMPYGRLNALGINTMLLA
jgi:hypothetical protein